MMQCDTHQAAAMSYGAYSWPSISKNAAQTRIGCGQASRAPYGNGACLGRDRIAVVAIGKTQPNRANSISFGIQ